MTPPRDTPTNSPPRGVLDPSWEEALRAGQEQDGAAGSVEPELAVLHLLRHARAPEALADAELDGLWRELEDATSPAPWWRRPWILWGAPIAAAAAVLVIVLRGPGEPVETDSLGTGAPRVAIAEPSTSKLLAQQFAILEPAAREALDANVDVGRGALRGQLLGAASGGAQ